MLSKTEHIAYWVQQSALDAERAAYMYEKNDFVFALFCTHLSLEKLCKALWIKQNLANYPPRIHELKYLLADTDIELDISQSKFVDDIQRYQIEGRYPDYKLLIYKYTTQELAAQLMENAHKLKQCLVEKI